MLFPAIHNTMPPPGTTYTLLQESGDVANQLVAVCPTAQQQQGDGAAQVGGSRALARAKRWLLCDVRSGRLHLTKLSGVPGCSRADGVGHALLHTTARLRTALHLHSCSPMAGHHRTDRL